MANSMAVPQQLSPGRPYALPVPVYRPEGNEIGIEKRLLHPHVHCSAIYNSRMDERGTRGAYSHDGVLRSRKHNGTLPLGSGAHYAKPSKSDRERPHLHVESNDTQLVDTADRPTDRWSPKVSGERWGVGVGRMGEGGPKV